eukprot:255376_1
MNPNYGKNIFGEIFKITKNWLRNRKVVKLIAQDQQRIKAEIRAGKDPEDVLGGFDLKFGLGLIRYCWMPPTILLGGTFSYVSFRIKYDIDYCYKLMSWCTEYDHLVNLIWKIEWVRPNFKEELFQSYHIWLSKANEDPEEFVKNINFAEFDKWCDWIEKLKYEDEREQKMHEIFQTDVLIDPVPLNIRSESKK